MHYPDTPGHQPPDTSREAAPTASEAKRLRNRVLDYLKHNGPKTADECADALNLSVLSVKPRLTELKRKGHIADTGARRKNASGKNAAVLEAITA